MNTIGTSPFELFGEGVTVKGSAVPCVSTFLKSQGPGGAGGSFCCHVKTSDTSGVKAIGDMVNAFAHSPRKVTKLIGNTHEYSDP